MFWWFPALLMATAIGIVGSNGGRAQLLVARFSHELGRSEGLLLGALITSSVTIGISAWLAWMASSSFGEVALRAMAAAAMLGAAVELLWPIHMANAKEPTRSVGAISLVLIVRQIFDAPRLMVFAAVTQLGFALMIGLGGALGAGTCLWFGWQFGEIVDRRTTAMAVRWTLGLISLVIGGLLTSETVSLAF